MLIAFPKLFKLNHNYKQRRASKCRFTSEFFVRKIYMLSFCMTSNLQVKMCNVTMIFSKNWLYLFFLPALGIRTWIILMTVRATFVSYLLFGASPHNYRTLSCWCIQSEFLILVVAWGWYISFTQDVLLTFKYKFWKISWNGLVHP